MGRRHFEGAADVPVSATVAWADKDRLLLPRQAERARRAAPRARHVWLRDCGHVPTWDDPAQVASVLLST
jgi:pimeloyl-ACP methyl ester carboxylesterase